MGARPNASGLQPSSDACFEENSEFAWQASMRRASCMGIVPAELLQAHQTASAHAAANLEDA